MSAATKTAATAMKTAVTPAEPAATTNPAAAESTEMWRGKTSVPLKIVGTHCTPLLFLPMSV